MIPNSFASEWETAWNSHDLDRILFHYSDDVVFRSKKAVKTVGTGIVRGKPALRAYWRKALDRQPDLRFAVTGVFHGHDMLVMTYTNQAGRSAAETLLFDAQGLVIEASACHADDGPFT
ncbi:nuclear transport factor 2 family protein [Shimia ponticola]|uniref:nuclear transport factor 2 family protein n=1 Tax=Shimia ponticola TaxID=2582893 RepID=UPI0011BF45DF|nr:nuclear transport factor 2 family protein [Shimia ponticola]